MLKNKVFKIVFVMACIMTLIMPYTTPVLAANLTSESRTAQLFADPAHKGGEEASGTLTDEQKEIYDKTPYSYQMGHKVVYKVREIDDLGYTNSFYCLNGNRSFPNVRDGLTYTNVANLKDATDSNVKSLYMSTSSSTDAAKWNENYKAVVWLVDNAYLPTQAPEQKDAYLTRAFKDYNSTGSIDLVKAVLTDDDIDVVQQAAIWYFTNNDTAELGNEELPALSVALPTNISEDAYRSITEVSGSRERYNMANHLYAYLINSAKEGVATSVTFPQFSDSHDQSNIALVAEGYISAGPFKLTAGTADKSDYTLKVVDQDGNDITNYKIAIKGETTFTTKKINEIFDKDYYIYLPESNKTTTRVYVKLNYTSYETEATVWENDTTDANGVKVYQPLVLITREETPHSAERYDDIERLTADLALRKYIVKQNDNTIMLNQISVDVSKLKDGTATTATYKHSKTPVTVKNGDTLVYEIRVYNEGDIDARGPVIIDSLPKGLELVENSTINSTYGWELVNEGTNRNTYKTEYLLDQTIEGFDKVNGTTLSSTYVQIECKVSDSAAAASVLTNIAEIFSDDISDRDSDVGSHDYINNDYDSSNYTGDRDNKSDLTDSNYYYKGVQDDDDFAKVIVEGRTFDLALKKFISKVNGNAPEKDRQPVVNVTKLKNGTSTDAEYTTTKTPLTVKKGDIVTYTLRVYNEGELAGYAEEVSDYLPEGLGFLVGYRTNVDNYWSIPEGSKTVKLNLIENATKNLSKDDFVDVASLNDVQVVIGKVKLTSTKLKSSATDNKNLIAGFDKENGTTLAYKDIQVTCIVLTDEITNNNFKNIAEIVKEADENKQEVTDIDSTPDTVDPNNYPEGEKRPDGTKQDDNDYEDLAPEGEVIEVKEFDLSLQKFISGVNKNQVKDREPKVTVENGKIKFTQGSTDPLKVENDDIIIYTIRVYNEGDIDGFAKEISDNLPKGLVFVSDHEVNKKYEWKLYDKDGKVTTDAKQATSVKTNYLSKEKSDANLIKAFDGKTVSYKDVQIAFKVDQSNLPDNRIIKNIAEITDDSDKDGNPVDDRDSTPGNNKDGEDDIDNEQVYVKYFDLALRKDLVKIIVTENGTTREISVGANDGLQKVEIHRKRINSTTVKFVYNITVTNEGEIAGYATEITDYIPDGLEFLADENKQWTKVSDKVITTNALAGTKLEPGQSASVQVVFKWINGENNFGTKVNVAEISKDKNDSNTPDRDSTPNNKVMTEDDIDNAEVVLTISTGTTPTYITLATTVLVILTTGVALIKKYVLI